MTKDRPKTFIGDFKQFFGRGLAIVLPSVLTLWILFYLVVFLYNNVGRPINRGVRAALVEVIPRVVADEHLPEFFRVSDEEVADFRSRTDIRGARDMPAEHITVVLRREKFKEVWNQYFVLEATGLIIAIVLIYFAGLLLGGFFGRRLYARVERLFSRMPGFKQVYPHVKQVTELVLGDRPIAFNRVVVVEYPRRGIWTVGLVTGESLRTIRDATGADILSVFIPSTPTPFTGFTITVRRDEAIDLPIQVDEAVRFFITGGVLVPEREVWGDPRPAVADTDAGPERPE